MSDFKSRLIEEKEQLEEKTTKLGSFLASENIQKLSKANFLLLHEQYELMSRYLNVLIIRIELIG